MTDISVLMMQFAWQLFFKAVGHIAAQGMKVYDGKQSLWVHKRREA
jgi:hypothetical protein